MRVTGGCYRGRRLEVPPRPVRPATDRMREALFNVLAARGMSLEGTHFLDLFSGSGSMAVEAASRGAASVTLVERDLRKRPCLRRNTSFVSAAVRIHISPCERFLARARPVAGCGWDLVFVDPPFAYRHKPELLAANWATVTCCATAPWCWSTCRLRRRCRANRDSPASNAAATAVPRYASSNPLSGGAVDTTVGAWVACLPGGAMRRLTWRGQCLFASVLVLCLFASVLVRFCACRFCVCPRLCLSASVSVRVLSASVFARPL